MEEQIKRLYESNLITSIKDEY